MNVDKILDYYAEAKSLNAKRFIENARLKARLEQRPAVSAKVLEESGLGMMPNLNYGTFRSIMIKRAQALERGFFISESFFHLRPCRPDPTGTLNEVGRIISRGVSSYLASDRSAFIARMQLLFREVVTYGYSAMVWPAKEDIIPEVIRANDIMFSSLSRTEPRGARLVFICQQPTEEQLTRWMKSAYGWKKNALRKYVKGVTDGNYRVIFAYACNERGKVDIVAFCPDTEEETLGEWPDFGDIDDVIVPIYYDTADGWAISVRGLGHSVYGISLADDDLLNRSLAAAKVGLSVIVRPRTEDAMDAEFADRPPFLIADPRADVEFGNIGASLQSGLGVRNVLNVLMNNLYGVFRAGRELYTSPERTATELSLSARGQSLEEDSLVVSLARQMAPMYRRILKAFLDDDDLVKKYIGDLAEPFRDLDIWNVSANVSAQATDIASVNTYVSSLMNILPMEDDPNARAKIKRMVYEAIGGRSLASELAPSVMQLPGSEDSRQDVENAVLFSGNPVAVGADDNHVSHIRRIFMFLTELLDDPERAQQARYDTLLAHLRGHIAMIATVPVWKVFYQSALEQLRKLEQAIEPFLKLREMTEQTLAVERNIPEAMTPQTAIKLREMEGRKQIGMYRAQVQAELQRQRLENKIALEREMANARKEMNDENRTVEELG